MFSPTDLNLLRHTRPVRHKPEPRRRTPALRKAPAPRLALILTGLIGTLGLAQLI